MSNVDQYEAYNAFTYTGDTQPLQVVEQDDVRKLIGYAVIWGAVSDLRPDGFRHRFNRGSIIWAPIVDALWSHSYAHPLGNTANKTLTIGEDDTGVRVEITLDGTTDGENTLKRVRSQVARGMSFGGRRISFAKAEGNILDITRFAGNEVSVVVSPAMTETAIVTAANSDQLAKAQQNRATKNKLNQFKLAMFRSGVR